MNIEDFDEELQRYYELIFADAHTEFEVEKNTFLKSEQKIHSAIMMTAAAILRDCHEQARLRKQTIAFLHKMAYHLEAFAHGLYDALDEFKEEEKEE